MPSKPSLAALLPVAQLFGAAATTYTWPSETDFLESLLYEQMGHGTSTLALTVAPCGNFPLGEGRSAPAEWIRTAYHDMATADVNTGIGGLDASIGFELDRAENPGRSAFADTLSTMRQQLTSRSSMADLIALGTIFSTGACTKGKTLIPFRPGRTDATEAGPMGVPEPQQEINSHVSAFKRQGFSKTEMIGLVACGHTLGGVHAADFPQIVPVPAGKSNNTYTQNFDETNELFDNIVATDYIQNKTQNALAFGHNATTRSDSRIFDSDGRDEINKFAASNDYFLKTCATLFEKMINTVPRKVKLQPPLKSIAVKPLKLFASVNSNGNMTLSGQLRLVDEFVGTPDRVVEVSFYPRSGDDCARTKTCVRTKAVVDHLSWTASTYGAPPAFPLFRKYHFEVQVPVSNGVSGFTVDVTDKVGGKMQTKHYDNNRKRFPFPDTLIPQAALSCATDSGNGLLNLTIAVRDDAKFDSLAGTVEVPSSLTELVPRVQSFPLTFKKVGTVKEYTLYNGQHMYNAGTYRRMYNLVGVKGGSSVKSEFNNAEDLPECTM